MSVFCKTLLASSLLLGTVSVQAAEAKYVIYLIGDGLSTAQRQITEYYVQEQKNDANYKLAINNMPVTGIITTQSADTLVTDSAAAGTALAAGVKTNNGYIAMLPGGKKVNTLLQGAEAKGWATGLVTTTRLTHATPAVFAANNESRNNENDIAADFLDANVDYFAGGGYRHFVSGKDSKRNDDRNLVKEFEKQGYTSFIGQSSTADFNAYQPQSGDKVFAAFTPSHLPYEVDRINKNMNVPTLADLTQKGIELLSQDKEGFFMMVEGGRIDHAAHANDIAGTIHDTIAFDDAVKVALAFYQAHPNDTLVVVAGDHETGGMGLGFGKQYFMNLDNVTRIKGAIDGSLQSVYNGDRKAFYQHIATYYGLTTLTDEEKASIEAAMDFVDSGKKDEGNKIYGGYNPVSIVVSHITSKRAGVYWTSYAHTATQLPVSAQGVQAEKFGGFSDNTDVAKNLATIMNVKIGG